MPPGVSVRLILLLNLLVACTPAEPRACGEPECADQCDELFPGGHLREPGVSGPDGPATVLSDAEYAVFAPVLQDLRAGLRPWAEGSVGLCRGAKGCVAPLPAEAGVLEPGSYVLRADLRAPRLGEDNAWGFIFRQSCLPYDPRDREHTHEEIQTLEEHTAQWVSDDRPAAFDALARITSPHPEHHLSCAWHLELHNPLKVELIEGTYEVPARSELVVEATEDGVPVKHGASVDDGAPDPEAAVDDGAPMEAPTAEAPR